MRVSIYRDGCVICSACWNLCPEYLEQHPEDRKSQVREANRIGGAPGEGEVPSEMECCLREAACCCPVQAIVLFD
ncbi:MAG: ferredoxin [Methanomicrobiales archaeon]|nr:ferredoxin [Methanomicrobia archaeon]MDD1645622.1 ferredoxin [Methanomicrobiales archaeon]MDD1646828.1 ferredoxin [Methanomicrobiales archaeon]